MKKSVLRWMVFVMLFCFAACGGAVGTEPTPAPAPTPTPEPTPEPDPWETFATEEEAEAAAGFDIRLPGVSEASVTYRVQTGAEPCILEAVFSDGEADVFTVRKAPGAMNEDTTEYSYSEEVKPHDSITVTLKGEDENNIRVAVWTQDKEDGAYSYCVTMKADGVNNSNAAKLVNTIVEDLPKGYTYGINKAIAAGRNHTVALKKDGTVVATGLNSYGVCDVGDWTDIVAVAAGDRHTVGLKSNGTVVGVGAANAKQLEGIENWTDVEAIACTYNTTYGFCKDGTVLCAGGWMDDQVFSRDMVSGLSDIVMADKFIYLDKNDKIYASGPRAMILQLGWDDMGAVSVSSYESQGEGMGVYTHYYAILSDGRVIARDCWGGKSRMSDTYEQEEFFGAKRITGGFGHAVAVMPDGTVKATGFNGSGQINVSEWSDIMDVSALLYTTVGLKSDGTVVAAGDNTYGQCDVSDWTDIGFPGMDETGNEVIGFGFDELFAIAEDTVPDENES